MTPEQFLALPAPIALRLLFDALDEETTRALLEKDVPKRPNAPKFDQAIYRNAGVQWASETDLEGLRFWLAKSSDPQSDPKYADANRRRAESLSRWIAWREWFPDVAWVGERDSRQGAAKPPSSRPTVYTRKPREQVQAPAAEPEVDLDSWWTEGRS